MKKFLVPVMLLFLSAGNTASQEISGNDAHIERVFENNCGSKIFYAGAEYRGAGVFFTEINGIRKIILETGLRYGPAVVWHGDTVAEIVIPTGSPFTHSYYYDFAENTLSDSYNFPLYYDIENNFVLTWGNEDFELYNAKTNSLLKIYDYRRRTNLTAFWPFINWTIEKENKSTITMHWEDWDDDGGIFVFEF